MQQKEDSHLLGVQEEEMCVQVLLQLFLCLCLDRREAVHPVSAQMGLNQHF